MRSLVALVLLLPALALSADEDRGPRGFFLGVGGGLMLGTATDGDGAAAPGFFGNGGYLRVGEEVIPGFTLGLRFGGGGAVSADDDYDTGLGGFGLESSLRAFPEALPGLVLVGAIGVGGGALEPTTDGGPDGSAGGAMFSLGVTYEFTVAGAPEDGLALAPSVSWIWLPDVRGNPATLSAFLVGVETVWYAGR